MGGRKQCFKRGKMKNIENTKKKFEKKRGICTISLLANYYRKVNDFC